MGRGAAQVVAQLDAEVVIASHNEEKLLKALPSLGDQASHVVVDVTDEGSVRSLFQQVGSFNHLFVTAGPGARSRFQEDPVETAQDYFQGKFWSTYQISRIASETIDAHGSVTYVSGGLAIRPESGSVAVTAAQNAVEGLARALAVELAPVRFNVIRPGLIDTSLWDFMEDNEREKMIQEKVKAIPVGRAGKAKDVGLAVTSLMVNGYINGSVINVDGGSFLR